MTVLAVAPHDFAIRIYQDDVLVYVKVKKQPWLKRVCREFDFDNNIDINRIAKDYGYITTSCKHPFTDKLREMLESNDDELKIMAIDLMING